MPFINKSEATKKVERPKSKRQMHKCHETVGVVSCGPGNSYADRTQVVIGQLVLARPLQEYVRDVVIG